MTIEEIRGVNNNEIDRFPIGMRVLAVDDNPTCLKVLEGLLRKCQYQVTPTNQAISALKMLRENRDRFDLIISDVYMPDMDGFKLLELVGLEMDLPVIMLSGNSDPKLVMKGIAHGACDYLVKPVRLQELQNIWQHVVRRKVESKSQSKSNNNNEKSDQGSGDQNVKVNRKRKEEDEHEDNGNDSDDDDDDQTTQKKPRVVWSIDLHRKFVAAVNQLGIEKAVPKRILDFMNVDGLTRENVASHLQKYRLYLKRISHQANMVVAFGGNKDSYMPTMRMNPLDGVGDYRTLSCSGRLPNATYAPPGMLSRLNSVTGVTLHSLTNHTQNKLQPLVAFTLPNHQNMNLFQPSFTLDHQQYNNKPNTQLSDFSSIEDSRIFTGTKLADLSSVDESRMFTGSSALTGLVPVLGSQPPSFSSKQLPIGDNYSYSATVNGGFGTIAAVPLGARGGGLVGDIVQNVHQNQKTEQCGKQDYNQYSQNAFNTLAFSALANGGGLSVPVGHSRTNSGASTLVQTEKPSMQSSEDYVSDQGKMQGGFIASNGYGSLDDIMTGIMKREPDSTTIMGGELGYDPYCFGQ